MDKWELSRQARISTRNADPRDPIELSEIYSAALADLDGPVAHRVRIVYDSISDFLCFSDPPLAAQFLKHNLVWEDRNRLASLYVYIRGVPSSGVGAQVDQRFMEWNCNSELELSFDKEGYPSLAAKAVFSTPRSARIQWDPDSRDYTVLYPDHAFKEAHTRELPSPPSAP